jgi:hypothetical protein
MVRPPPGVSDGVRLGRAPQGLAAGSRTRAFYQLASTVQYEPGLYGIAVAKNNTVLRDALQAAL